jgi:hypothetical protein
VDPVKATGSLGVKVAVRVWLPGSRVVVVVAVPSGATGTGLPRGLVPSLNTTVPAAFGVMVALRVSCVPAGAGESGVTTSAVLVVVRGLRPTRTGSWSLVRNRSGAYSEVTWPALLKSVL